MKKRNGLGRVLLALVLCVTITLTACSTEWIATAEQIVAALIPAATNIVALVAAMLYSFIRPLVDQANQFADHFPTYVADARAGRGTVGHLVKKYRVDDYLKRNEAKLRALAARRDPSVRDEARAATAQLSAHDEAARLTDSRTLADLLGPSPPSRKPTGSRPHDLAIPTFLMHKGPVRINDVDRGRAAVLRRPGAACAGDLLCSFTGNLISIEDVRRGPAGYDEFRR